MEIDKNELRESVFKNLYLPAVESIYKKGRFGFNGSRAAGMLVSIFEEAGEKSTFI